MGKPKEKIKIATPMAPRTRSIGRDKWFAAANSAVRQPRAIASMPPRYEYSLRDFVPMRERCAPERSKYDKHEKNSDEQLPAAKEPANERKKEVEHFLDGQRPEISQLPGR